MTSSPEWRDEWAGRGAVPASGIGAVLLDEGELPKWFDGDTPTAGSGDVFVVEWQLPGGSPP